MRRGLIILAAAILLLTLFAAVWQIDDLDDLFSHQDYGGSNGPGGNVVPDPEPDKECEHVDKDANHLCDVCGEKLAECADTNGDHLCDRCAKVLTECVDDNNDHFCDSCAEVLTECADGNKDHKCDLCSKALTECADGNKDHKCDLCSKALTECADGNKDHKCDLCGKVLTECEDVNTDHFCDICGKRCSECSDGDSNHYCDDCQEKLSDCVDSDKDHYCDVCFEFSECEDLDSDHNCDICEERLGECTDNDWNHLCDICGLRLSSCENTDLDGCCDTCYRVLDEFLANSEFNDNGSVTLSFYGIASLLDPIDSRQWRLYGSGGELVASGNTNGADKIDLSSHMEAGFNYLLVVSYDYGGAALDYYRSDLTLFSGPAPEGIEIPEGAVVLFENERITDTFAYPADPEFNVQYYAILDNTVLLTGVFVWENGGDESDTESFYYRFYDKDNRLCLEYERFGEWGWRLVGDYGSEALVTVYSIP